MEAVEKRGTATVEEYLAGELRGETRHEFLGGTVYGMAGASEEHNAIAATTQPEQALELASLDFTLPLNLVYEGVKV